jgi:3-phytase
MKKIVSPIVALIVLAALHGAMSAALAAPQVAKAPLDAEELAALPGGAWLALNKRGLRLVGADGIDRATLALRG